MLIKKEISNSIEFSDNKGYVILKTNKTDINYINDKYGLDNLPATYLVIGETTSGINKYINFYVGESSVNVISRLKESFAKRPWIQEVFIITSPQGNLTMEIVKSLEFMILQTLNNCFTNLPVNVIPKCDNGTTGVVGYRAQLGENNYTLLINDIFKLFFKDVLLYSNYYTYFNKFLISFNINPSGRVFLNKSINKMFASYSVTDVINIIQNSIISIELDTLGNSNDGVKLLFKNLLSNKSIYPAIIDNRVQWLFSKPTILQRYDSDNLAILFTNSLNATTSNSSVDYRSYSRR